MTNVPRMMMAAAGTGGSPTGLYAFGKNTSGELGLGNTTSYSSPVQVGSSTDWTSITAGRDARSGAINSSNEAYVWGAGSGGALGLGNTTDYSLPVQLGAAIWLNLKFGSGNGSIISTAYKLYTWGKRNDRGQQAHGNTTLYSSPVQVGALTDWLSGGTGGDSNDNMRWIKTDGTLWSAGYRQYVGDSQNAADRSSPVQIGALTTWVKVATSSGNGAAIAYRSDGTLWAFGRNLSGALGLDDETNRSSPVQIGALTTWRDVAVNSQHGGGVNSSGELFMWGNGSDGRLGLGNTTSYSSPVKVGSLTNWSKVYCADKSTIVKKTDGTAWAFGINDTGQLGLGNLTAYSSPVQIGTETSWSKISIGREHTLAIMA